MRAQLLSHSKNCSSTRVCIRLENNDYNDGKQAGRKEEKAPDWRWVGSPGEEYCKGQSESTGKKNAKTETQQPGVMKGSTDRHAGRSYGALIPLSGEITFEFLLFLHRMPLFIHLQ